MKRFIPLLSLIICVVFSSAIWAATWYVDGWNGVDTNSGTSANDAFETIRRALNRSSNGDTIRLVGEFVEAPWDTLWDEYGRSWDSSTKTLQISVDKSNLIIYGVEVSGELPTIYGYSPDDNLDFVMRIDQTGNTVEYIKFDGYYDEVGGGDVSTYNVLYSTPDADYTEISNCEFTNFGYNFGDPGHSLFYAIIGGGQPKQSTVDYLENYKINDNTFYDNEFEGWGSHEIYVNATKNSEIKRNLITNNGYGDPIKFRDRCSNITVDNNTVYGALHCFVSDYPDTTIEGNSSGIIVTNNTFTDPNSVIDDGYKGPCFTPRYAAFISEYSGNTVVEGGDKEWDVKGITTNGSSLFMAYNIDSYNHIVVFREHNGPVFKRIIEPFASNCVYDGNMCHITSATDTTVIVSSIYNNSIRVFKVDVDDSTSSCYDDLLTSTYDITAMCPYNDTYFITALRYYNDVNGVWYARIYKSTDSDLLYHKIYEQPETTVYSVTALAVTGNTLVFGAYINSSSSKIYTGTIPSSGTINPLYERESLSYEVTGLTYLSSTLMTAIQYGSYTRIYSGTTSDPVGTLRETYASTNLIALESDSEFIFMVKDNIYDDDEERTIYFTDSTTNMDDEIIYHSKWYTEDF